MSNLGDLDCFARGVPRGVLDLCEPCTECFPPFSAVGFALSASQFHIFSLLDSSILDPPAVTRKSISALHLEGRPNS